MESFGENIKTTNDKFPYVKLNNIIKTLIGETPVRVFLYTKFEGR